MRRPRCGDAVVMAPIQVGNELRVSVVPPGAGAHRDVVTLALLSLARDRVLLSQR